MYTTPDEMLKTKQEKIFAVLRFVLDDFLTIAITIMIYGGNQDGDTTISDTVLLLSMFYAILTLSLHFCCAKPTDAEKTKAKTKTLCCATQTATQTTSGKKNAEVELGADGEEEFAPVGAGHV